MKAVILDMYGVILKETGDGFVPYVQHTFPDLKPEDIWTPWNKADIGELSSIEVFEAIGYKGDLEKIEKEYLDTIEIEEAFFQFANVITKNNKLALISNDSSRWSKYLREKFDINKYFDVISVSGDLKIKKPDERIYQLTLEKLGCVASDCIYVDDRRYNLAAAKALGIDTILFNSREVQYDGKSVINFKELEIMIMDS
ncbi:MAG: HAD-IA family hydrolase [Lachnotalea sp.]